MSERKSHRLPTTVIPERYQIRLTPDLVNWKFTGEVKIALQVHQRERRIILNAAELELHSVALKRPDGAVLHGHGSLDGDSEQATLTFPDQLPEGSCELLMSFSGILNDKLHGFYRSTYKGADGTDKPLASTQFESTDARRRSE